MRAQRGWFLSTADLAVHVLEESDTALTVYDIQRSIRRDLGIDVSQEALQDGISGDRRFCWAGKGLYGLYRHGLIPGPRSLAGIARVFLYSHGPLQHAPLEFVMKYVGYRFQSASLYGALNRDPDVSWFYADGGWYWDTARTPEADKALRVLCAYPTPAELDVIVLRCAETVKAALAERERRLS
jgi:hypothetical protein